MVMAGQPVSDKTAHTSVHGDKHRIDRQGGWMMFFERSGVGGGAWPGGKAGIWVDSGKGLCVLAVRGGKLEGWWRQVLSA